MTEALQPSGNTNQLTIDNGVIDEVADHVYRVQLGIVGEELAKMCPLLAGLCGDLRTATSDELRDRDQVPGDCRAVGFAAGHMLAWLSAGEQIDLMLQLRAPAVLSYVNGARHSPAVLESDYETIFDQHDRRWTNLRRFVAGDLRPGQEGGHGCTNLRSRRTAQLMLVLAGSVGLSTGSFIYERTPPPVQQTPARRRHVRATGRPY
jgi:hypothetical protein